MGKDTNYFGQLCDKNEKEPQVQDIRVRVCGLARRKGRGKRMPLIGNFSTRR